MKTKEENRGKEEELPKKKELLSDEELLEVAAGRFPGNTAQSDTPQEIKFKSCVQACMHSSGGQTLREQEKCEQRCKNSNGF